MRRLSILLFFILNTNIIHAECLPYPTIKNETIIKNCKSYKAIGVNYFDAFYRVLKDPEDKSYIQGFEKLSKNGIPFVRMMASGFWPKDWELYFKNKEKYFALLDNVVNTAKGYNVGIIMSLFWKVSTLPDLMGEPIGAWGDPESKTIKFMKEYAKEIVIRYKDEPAVWGYEFGNEYNLLSDLPQGYKKVAPQYGTPIKRTELDKLSLKDILFAFTEFAETIRLYDNKKIISTGNSLPRPTQYHLAYHSTWEKDTSSQFLEILNQINPYLFNTISIHIYPTHLKGYFVDFTVNNFENLLFHAKLGTEKGKRILFIGEFGVCRKEKHLKNMDISEEKETFEKLIKAILDSETPLSALWVYDIKKKEDPCNVTFESDRAYQLEWIIKLNKKFLNN